MRGLVSEGLTLDGISLGDRVEHYIVVVRKNVEVAVGIFAVKHVKTVYGQSAWHTGRIAEIVVTGIRRGNDNESVSIRTVRVPDTVSYRDIAVPGRAVVESQLGDSVAVDVAVFDKSLAVAYEIDALMPENAVLKSYVCHALMSIKARKYAVFEKEILAEV